MVHRYAHHRVARLAVALAAAAALATPYAVSAQPHGGPGGPGGPGAFVEQVLAQLKDKLALDTSQQVQWQAALEQTKAAHAQSRTTRESVRATVDAELAKAEPDLAAIATAMDSVQAQGMAARREVRDSWLRIYAGMRAEQKAIVRDAIKSRLARMEENRGRMQPKHGRG
jgi:Spy/CpxP family protein refolding chaperone